MEASTIPDDIIFGNILTRIPINSLCRCKCVSNPWLSSIKDNKILPKTQPQWIRIPPLKQKLPSYWKYDMDVHIFSLDKNGAQTILNRYTPPPDLCFQKHYNGLICSYNASFRVTVFNISTQESINISLPFIESRDIQGIRIFEYGFAPLSRKYKVLTYGGLSLFANPMDIQYGVPSNFEIVTLGEERLVWRSLEDKPKTGLLPDWVTIANGKLFWFISRKDLNFGLKDRQLETADVISFNFDTEKFATIPLPNPEAYVYFKRPLFEFEGSLCYVENICIGREEERTNFPLNVWMLKNDENGVWVPMVKNIVLPLNGTDLQLVTGYFDDKSAMVDAEFSICDGHLVIAAYDNKDQYVYWCSFLNGHCKRMKIIGQPFKHPTVSAYIEVYNNTIL